MPRALAIMALAAASFLGASLHGPAAAEDYPYDGYFAIAGDANALKRRDIVKCALSFFAQNRDGSFVSYHLDHAAWKTSGRVKYVQHNSGRCVLGPAPGLESCTVSFDANAAEQGVTYYDMIQDIGDEAVKVMFLGSSRDLASIDAVLSARANATPVAYIRCGFSPTALTGALSAERSTLSQDERVKLLAPDEALLDDAGTGQLARDLGLAPPQ